MATFQVKVTDTADDGYEQDAAIGQADGISAGFATSAITGFVRFQNVTVAQGATVDSATVTVNVLGVGGTPNTTIFGVDADNAAAFADPGNMPSAAVLTTANADPDPAGTGTKVITVTAIVQEIINRAGWASGNAMAFVITDNAGSGENNWFAEDLEDAGGTAEAILDITYTAAAAGGGSRGAVHLLL